MTIFSRLFRSLTVPSTLSLAVLPLAPACAPSGPDPSSSGGLPFSGGAAAGGEPGSGGVATGGFSSSGSASSAGGVGSGGAPSGGSGGLILSTGGALSGTGGTATGGALATGGEGTGGAANPATWQDMTYMLNSGCAGCHGLKPMLYLVPDDGVGERNDELYNTLLTHKVSYCEDALLVVPGDPSSSAILKLLNMECTKNGEPFFMPETCGIAPCFPEDWMQQISGWIEAGAPQQ